MICPICGVIMVKESGREDGKTYNRVCLMCGHKSYTQIPKQTNEVKKQ